MFVGYSAIKEVLLLLIFFFFFFSSIAKKKKKAEGAEAEIGMKRK